MLSVKKGERYGRLTVVREAIKKGKYRWVMCRCDCGTVREFRIDYLNNGTSTSCGCRQRELARDRLTTHNMSESMEYESWSRMKNRCNNVYSKDFEMYGGRGIKVCERWNKFENFYADMGARPSPKHSLERIDNDGNYEPDNCKWATIEEQNNNKRNNALFFYNGRYLTVGEGTRLLGLDYRKLYHWLNRNNMLIHNYDLRGRRLR